MVSRNSLIDNLIDMADKNDLESARKILQEKESVLKVKEEDAFYLSQNFFPPYEMAYHLGHKEFCILLIKELEKFIKYDSCTYLFFDDTCKFK